eukprot:TRINITY_DN14138_c0_g2_i2.p1 TRINITY_DN14138_c0_g2~~TRINITY_DN14138_c0_g2_i2.p1  ORF type:complete len:126 (+),score=28.46 TRINITY_DN14138_c0_g2_i2:227-604(+)
MCEEGKHQPCDVGCFRHCPQPFNYDVFIKEDKSASLFFMVEKESVGWQTVAGDVSGAEAGCAHPATKERGQPSAFPAGRSVLWRADGSHYRVRGEKGFAMIYFKTAEDAEAQHQVPALEEAHVPV